MTQNEYIEYIFGYVKACKIKGHNFIGVFGNKLICTDEMCSMMYQIELEYPSIYIIANIDTAIIEGNLFDLHVANMMSTIIGHIVSCKTNLMPITRKDSTAKIPDSSGDSAKPRLYYYDHDPSKEILLYDFYNMMPLSKADSYTMEAGINPYFISGNVITVRYNVFKKKPKCKIEIYRNVLNLI